jgi:hypothetical protein
MADKKLSQINETLQSDNESLIHVVKDGVSYKQTKSNFLADVSGYNPVSNVSAVWNSGFIFDVTADLYPIAGISYSSLAGQVILNDSDSVFDRIDLIVAIAPVSPATIGTVGKLTGTLATSGLVAPPDYDPTTVFPIKQVTVKANSTVPSQTSKELVFNEGTEWTPTYPSSYALVTDDFYTGTKSIYATGATIPDKLKFTSSTQLSRDEVDLLEFYIKTDNPNFNYVNLVFQFQLAGAIVARAATYIIDPSPNQWNRVQFTKEQLALGSGVYDELVIYCSSPSAGANFWIDNITLYRGSGLDNVNLNISQFVNDVPYARLTDLTGNDYSEWASYSGTRVGGNLLATLGDYDVSADGTRIEINDLTAEINNFGYTTSSQGFGVQSEGNAFIASILSDNVTSSTSVQLPDASGTLALEADASGFNGNLTPSDTTLQAIAQKFNDYVATVVGYVTLAGANIFTGNNSFQGSVEIDNGSEGANAGLGMSSHKIQYLGDGVSASDAVNKGQLDAATPYQTPTDLLTAVKTVDGVNSGLDADLLDGLHASRFLRSDAIDTATGDLIFGGETIFNGDVLFENADGIEMNGRPISGLQDGSNPTDAVNKSQLDVATRPYKVYTALISQENALAPTVKVLENTLGGEIVWTFVSTGLYDGTLAGAFTLDKTTTMLSVDSIGNYGYIGGVRAMTSNIIRVRTNDSTDSAANNILNDNTLEIRVYN